MKKATWMIIVILVVSCLAGCNTTEKALIDQLTELVNWPYMSINFSGKIVLKDSMYFGTPPVTAYISINCFSFKPSKNS